MPWSLNLLLRVVLCLAASTLLYRAIGAVGLVLTAPLYGVALAGPILHILGRTPAWWRWWRYHGYHGRFYAIADRQVMVHEDAQGHRWVELDAVRQWVPDLPADPVLAHRFRASFTPASDRQDARLRADALLTALRPLPDPRAIRLRRWLEREVVLPAERARHRAAAAPQVAPAPVQLEEWRRLREDEPPADGPPPA